MKIIGLGLKLTKTCCICRDGVTLSMVRRGINVRLQEGIAGYTWNRWLAAKRLAKPAG